MLRELKHREKVGAPIQVGLIGAGAMGKGIALQIRKTPGMQLAFIADVNEVAARKAQKIYQHPVPIYANANQALDDPTIKLDVVVEASNAIAIAAHYCLKAIYRKAHVILMNAEVDLVFSHYLQHIAQQHNVVLTSDAGDQHGVLMRMIEEIELWGFKIIQAGNIKGFLDRYATTASIEAIAKKLKLNASQCLAYTDGTKLNIEMALIANGANLLPRVPGMEGPRAKQVIDALTLFDFDSYPNNGCVDYILGAEPGGGVYVIAHSDDNLQNEYLHYYKVKNSPPYYLFYRPYHLCHIETPRAIAKAVLYRKAVLQPNYGRKTDVYAYAKGALRPGTMIKQGIGSDYSYGLIHNAIEADSKDYLPIGLLENEIGARIIKKVSKDEPLCFSNVDLPQTSLLDLYEKQKTLLRACVTDVAMV